MVESMDNVCVFMDGIQQKLEGTDLPPSHRTVWEQEYAALLDSHYLDLPVKYAQWMEAYRQKRGG